MAKILPVQNRIMGATEAGILFDAHIISNELLTDGIFGYLTDSELLNCSLVSKTWNSICRSILNRHRKCYLRITSTNTAKSFENLLSLLESSVYPPFNGVSLSIPTYLVQKFGAVNHRGALSFPDHQDASTTIADLFGKIYEKLVLKNVVINLTETGTFLAEPLLGTLFRPQIASQIEYLQIWWYMDDEVIFRRLVPNGLPNLFTLELGHSLQQMRPRILQPVLLASPNLGKLIGPIFPYQIPMFAAAKKLSLIKHVEIDLARSTAEELEFIKKYGVTFDKATVTGLRFSAQNSKVMEKVNLLADALRQSQEGLTELELNYLELIVLQIAMPDFLPFPNCKKLTLLYDLTCPGEILNLKWVNFSRLFPNLTSVVVIIINAGRVPLIWERGFTFIFESYAASNPSQSFECSVRNLKIRMEDGSGSWTSKKVLKICDTPSYSLLLMLFAPSIHMLFPCVRNLAVAEEIQCLNINNYWRGLESFSIIHSHV
ncbi:unnamed protein product [Allacma fusca]|uniref:F-box domain-containing protein n=2 Tax=Allacma fusca TaxID=39272 RepID=A0A8J2PI00_9HEXA|nr:unnamed protein product [Allacma fusca]